MKVDLLIPKPTNKLLFSFQGLRLVPEMLGCYVLTNFHDDIIYLGVSHFLKQRALSHFDDSEKHSQTKEGKACWYYYIILENEKIMFQTERGWLNQYELEHGELPPLNKIHSPIS